MKFSQDTLKILKNFTAINKSIWFRTNGKLITVAPNQYNIVGTAQIQESFENEFGIFEVSRFLGALSLFDPDKHDITFTDKNLTIKHDNQSLVYNFCTKNVIDVGPKGKEINDIQMPEVQLEFDLSSQVLVKTLQITNLMGFPEIAIKGENGFISVQAYNPKDPNPDNYSYRMGETNKTFNSLFAQDLFSKLMEDSYKVSVAKGVAQFKGTLVTYYLTPNTKSTLMGSGNSKLGALDSEQEERIG